ncbi:MMPL family transporter [Aliiglaciecola sp. NS0011-25]|uniref:efflux RND transporter permease subunit n=1 Tax=Aliiglaciecola sp. NS0011-25 TaxID=3127654 RepID=UPI0031042128
MTSNNNISSYTTRYFAWVIEKPKRVILISLIFILTMGFGISKVHKESSVDAFVPQDHPAAFARDRAAEIFGLEDPIVVGLVAAKNRSAFTPENIETLRRIESRARALSNVKKHNFISILNESAIRGEQGDLLVEAIVPSGPLTMDAAKQAFVRLNSMSMMKGLLASKNGDTLTLIIPVYDANHATETYRQVLAIANSESTSSITIHVTGVASMNGRLAQMVTSDTRLFIPVAVTVAMLIVWLALRNLRGLIGPFYVIAGSAATTIGFMGWMGAQYYLITTALPVIIMAIAIADSLHISTLFLHKCRTNWHKTRQQNLLDALNHTYLPITLTTVTTVAGFCGLALGSTMQPIAEFGWMAALGAIMAWLLSISALPAIMALSKLQAKENQVKSQFTFVDACLKNVTQQATQKPATTASVLAVLTLVMGYFALQANFDYQRQNYFQANEQVRIADITLNERLSGLNFLDVVVSGSTSNDLITPDAMKAIARLQAQLNAQAFVAKTTSVADYMTLMHNVLTDEPIGSFPSKQNAPAQYMFLYESSGDPGDFDEEIDLNYQHALIRAQLSTDRFSNVKNTVQDFQEITKRWSLETGLEASVSGRVAVNVGWMSLLAESHFVGLGLAILFVFMSALIMFRSFFKALLSLVPVITGVLFTYAAMGALNIDIAPATSMTAAISTGLGVDFAIHLIYSVNQARQQNTSIEEAFSGNYLIVARACLFSALALAVALGVVCLSSAPPLQWFGALVAMAALGSLMGAIFVIPALYALFTKHALLPKLKGAY